MGSNPAKVEKKVSAWLQVCMGRILSRILKLGVSDSPFIKSSRPSQNVGVPLPQNRHHLLQVKQIFLFYYFFSKKKNEDISQEIWTDRNDTNFHCFQLNLVPLPIPQKFVAVCIKRPWVMNVKWNIFIILKLTKAVICYGKLVHEICLHILIMDNCVELLAKCHFSVYICIMLRSIHIMKICLGLIYMLKFWCTSLIRRKSVANFSFNLCLFHMHFWQENAVQSNMGIARFSPKTVSHHAFIWIILTCMHYH